MMFEVKKILKSRLINDGGLLVKEYYVQWADSADGKSYKDSWEPMSGLKQCSQLLDEFETREKEKAHEEKDKEKGQPKAVNKPKVKVNSYYRNYELGKEQESLGLETRRSSSQFASK